MERPSLDQIARSRYCGAVESRSLERIPLMDAFWSQILAFFIAFIPGVLIALIADTLSRRRAALREQRVSENARTLLSLEVGANLNALKDFWQAINSLDTEHQRETEA